MSLPLVMVSLLFFSLLQAQRIGNGQGAGISAAGAQEESPLWIRPVVLSSGWRIHSWALNDSGMLVFGGGNAFGSADGLVLVTDDEITKFVSYGESIAGMEDGVFAGVSKFALNDKGEVVLTGWVRSTRGHLQHGLFLFSAGRVRRILAAQDPVPGSPGKVFFFFDRVWLNNRGTILFVGLAGSLFLGSQRLEPGLFLYTDGYIEKIALSDDLTPFGEPFGFGADTPAFLSDDGSVTWGGSRIFRFANKTVSSIIGPGDRLAGGKTLTGFTLSSLSANDAGDVVFQASFGNTESEQGLFLRVKDGRVVELLVDGAPAPIGGRFSLWYTETGRDRFGNPFRRNRSVRLSPILNNAGSVLFSAPVKGGGSPGGIFLFSDGALKKVAADGDPVSDDAAGTYLLVPVWNEQPWLPTKYSLNDSNAAVFSAEIRRPSGTSTGLFLYAQGNVRRLVSSGDLASETRGQVFNLWPMGIFNTAPFTAPLLNNRGDIGFWSELSNGECERGIFLAAIARPLLLPNADFETTGTNGLPANWTTAWSDSGTGEAFIYGSAGSDSFDGRNVLRLHVGPGGGSIFVLSDPIPVSPDSAHLISSQMRFNLEDYRDAVYFSVIHLDGAGNGIGFSEVAGFSGDNFWDWKQKQLGFRTTPNTAAIRVRFGLVSARASFLDVDAVQ